MSAEGLVIAESQKGYRVTSLSADELMDLTEARVEIEAIALSRSIERGDLEWETNVVAAWHRLAHTDERVKEDARRLSDQWVVAHAAFHGALASACGSAKLIEIRSQLYEQSERYRRYSAPLDRSERNVAAEHQRIFDAAVARDVQAATRAISDHLRATAAILSTSPVLKGGEPGSTRRSNVEVLLDSSALEPNERTYEANSVG